MLTTPEKLLNKHESLCMFHINLNTSLQFIVVLEKSGIYEQWTVYLQEVVAYALFRSFSNELISHGSDI